MSASSARATYQALPAKGGPTCPASGQFFHDQFCWLGKTSNARLACVACPTLGSSAFSPSGIVRGGFPSAAGVQSLKRVGVGLILDLRTVGEDAKRLEAKASTAEKLAYFNLPMDTSTSNDTATNRVAVYRALGLLRYFRAKHPDRLVYFHCQRGEDRTGLVAAAYRFLLEHADRTEIEKEMKSHYFNTNYLSLKNVWLDMRASDVTSIIEPTAAEKVQLDL